MTDKEKIRAEIERRMKASAKIEEEYKGIDKDLSAKAQLKAAEYQSMLVFIESMQEEPVSEDLEEEIGRYFKENGNKWAYIDVARHFANWQKQQMMKDAVDKKIETNFLRAYLCLYVDELGFEVGDKVKLIIIKEG